MFILFSVIVVVFYIFLKLNSAKVKGFVGETKVSAHLHFLGSEYITMHDVLIWNAHGSTSQIDHIVLSEYGIFVIETKNYKGWIFGNERAENWMQVIYKEKHQFRNPVKQTWGHVYALQSVLSDFPQAKYYSIIVFSGSAVLKEIESAVPVIYENALNGTIRSYSMEKCLTAEQVANIRARLECAEITAKGSRKAHVQNIRRDVTERQLKIENLICPRCNGALKLRNGKNGKFYGCSNYPRCRFTMSY